MSNRNQVIIEQFQSLTSVEVSELVGQLEATFNVDVSSTAIASSLMFPIDSTKNSVEEIEEGSSFDVVLEEVPAVNKIAILKVVRSLTELKLSLRESKDLIDSAPIVIRSGISFHAVGKIKQQLEAAGAIVSIC